jgi:hypothetical protein
MSSKGRPAIGNRTLGVVLVKGRSLVPKPAANIIALKIVASGMIFTVDW